MMTAQRPPSKSFSGTAPSLERLKYERHGQSRKHAAELQELINTASTINYRWPCLRRTLSLPDCKEMKRLIKSNSKKFASQSLEITQRVRSVTFAPEILLFNAVAENDIEELKQLIEKYDVNLNHQSPEGLSALHYTALEGSFECMEFLVSKGVDVDVLDSKGCSALDFAVRGGHFDCAACLIKAGAEFKKIVNGLRY